MKAFFHTIVARLHGFLRFRSLDSDFNQELDEHLAMSTEDKIRRGMTADTAIRLGRYFRTDPQFWMNLQAAYDLSKASAEHSYSSIRPRAA